MNRLNIPEQEDQYNVKGQVVKYRVDNWQIPVPIGDASAHFLIGIVNEQQKVINAFFMDGGDDAQSGDKAWRQISEALTVIDNEYGSEWKFDAVATTHHDRDHYKGLKDLMDESDKRNNIVSTYRKSYFAKDLTYYSGNPGYGNDGKGGVKFDWSPSNSPFVLAGQDSIDIDMFSRTRLFQGHEKDLEEFDSERGVRKWTKKDDQLKRPRFVIVGANGYGVHTNLANSKMVPTPTENQKSLLALVYWPVTGRTSYFTGGDGNPKVELNGVVPWMKKNTDSRKKHYPLLPVDMIKLDHHGSLKESLNDKSLAKFHFTILGKMEPQKVLVTPGHKHGHPNWAILQLVRNHFLKMRSKYPGDDPKGQSYRLYTTRSPYWMS